MYCRALALHVACLTSAGSATSLSVRLATRIPKRRAAAGVWPPGGGANLLGTPDAIAALPAPVRDAVLGGFADSLSDIYIMAVPIALLGFLVVLFLPELALRTPVRGEEPVVTHGEAIGARFEIGRASCRASGCQYA